MNLPKSSKKLIELHFGCKKIKEFSDDDLKRLYTKILSLCKLVGVTQAPEQDIVLLLISHLQSHHQDFSIEEIEWAFSLATAGKLGFDFNHYNRITPQLISLTLNKYNIIRNKEVIRLNDEVNSRKHKIERPSLEELQQTKITYTLELFDMFRQNSTVRDWGNLAYKFLKKINCIQFDEQERSGLIKQAKENVLLSMKKKKNFYNIQKQIEEAVGDNSHQLRAETNQLELIRYFETLLKENKNLEDEIKTALQKNKHHN